MAKKQRWRCLKCNCPIGYEFVADGPKCPSCGAGDPIVIPLVNVHFLSMAKNGPIKGGDGLSYAIACRPEVANYGRSSLTGEPSAVTCPACKEASAFKKALDLYANGSLD